MNILKHYDFSEIFQDFLTDQEIDLSTQEYSSKYTLLFPPPNVTGKLHYGHTLIAFFLDAYARKNQFSKNIKFITGTDHAGIAAQYIVEKQIKDQKIDKLYFMEQWQTTKRKEITEQLVQLALYTDYKKMHFTMEQGFEKLVIDVFIKMYNDGLIYRDYRPINWDPALQTVISDYEVDMQEIDGSMFYILFPGDNFSGIIVATSRPETIPGDVAIGVHPNDERYKSYIGKFVSLPLQPEIKIPIIADSSISPEIGTGALKITPAHAFTDFQLARQHNLAVKQVINKDAKLISGPFEGMHILKAREKYKDIAIRIEQIKHLVPFGDRSGALLEVLPLKQWFCNITKLAKDVPLPNFYPAIYKQRIEEHLQNLQPWCLSRQIWWGHRIPAYLCDNGEYIIAKTHKIAMQLAQDRNLTILHQEIDVLDTWFSSSLWHIGTQAVYKPVDLLVTGYDILNIWVARMCIQSKYLYSQPAFKDVVITGLIRDNTGAKMSKSKQNTLDPIDLINQYGVDALRFAMMHACSIGQDIVLHKTRIEGMHRFFTKVWNVARFCLNHNLKIESPKNDWDCYWAMRFNELQIKLDKLWASYKISDVCTLLYAGFKEEFANFYLEGTKVIPECSLGYFLAFWLQQLYPIAPCIVHVIWKKCFNVSILKPLNLNNIQDTQKMHYLIKSINNIKRIKAIMPNAQFKISEHQEIIYHFTKVQFTDIINARFNNIEFFVTDADQCKIYQRYQKLQTEYMQVMATKHYFNKETPENIRAKNIADIARIQEEIKFLDNFLKNS